MNNMNAMSFKEVLSLHEGVLGLRRGIVRLFDGIPIGVTIGGSYILKYYYKEFADRPMHDIDIIVRGTQVALCKVRERIGVLRTLGLLQFSMSQSGGICIGHFMGYQVDMLLVTTDKTPNGCFMFETPEDVLKAKRDYVEKYRKLHKEPREKDLKDIAILEGILECPLPF